VAKIFESVSYRKAVIRLPPILSHTSTKILFHSQTATFKTHYPPMFCPLQFVSAASHAIFQPGSHEGFQPFNAGHFHF
jgi:hypothetical protein